MITIGKRFTFDAAHRLPLHEGKCRRPHGHTYILEVDLTGQVDSLPGPSQGMVEDYYVLKTVVETEILSRFDHRDLNVEMAQFDSRDPEKENVTTAETLARVFGMLLSNRLNCSLYTVTRVRLQETPNSWAEWRP